MTSNPYEPPKDRPDVERRFSLTTELGKRCLVIIPGIVVCFLLSVAVGEGQFRFWGWIVAGPYLAMSCGMGKLILMGWLGALLALVHPIKPNVITGFVTIIGLILWFLSGFIALAWVYST